MTSINDEIENVKEEIRKTPHNKSTEHHLGNLYGKLAKLKQDLEKRKSAGSSAGGYSVKKTGDATIALVGFPSVGKSTLINALTNVESEVASYDFTTLEAIPGMMEYKSVKFQIIDLPGIITRASEGRGGGREVLSVVRNADVVLIMLEAGRLEDLHKVKQELYKVGVRLDQTPPDVIFEKKSKGGIEVLSTKSLNLSKSMIKEVMRSYGYVNASVVIKEKLSMSEFIDALLGNRHYAPSITVINKCDKVNKEELKKVKDEFPNAVLISAKEEIGLDELKERVWEESNLMRVYLKPRGGEPDYNNSLIMEKNSTVKELGERIHDKFVKDFRYGKVWGDSAKFPAQKVGLNHELKDEDVLTIIK